MVQSQPSTSFDMLGQWQEFIETKVNSFIKWDLIRFFHDNPHLQDTAENIAAHIARDKEAILCHLDGLVQVDLLSVTKRKQACIYQLAHDSETRALVGNFVAACRDRDFRVTAIHCVVHNPRCKLG